MTIKIFLTACCSLLILGCSSTKDTTASTSDAEPQVNTQRSQRPGGGQRGDQMAAQREELLAALDLSDEQRTQFDQIQKNFRDKMRAIRAESGGDRMTMMGKMRDLRDDYNAEVKKILSEEQYQAFLEHQQNIRRRRN